MALPRWIEQSLLKSVDAVMGSLAQPRPTSERLNSCRLIAHRGAHGRIQRLQSGAHRGNTEISENTIQAFDRAIDGGASGIEFDIRWTKDGEPIVFHDETCKRVFRASTRIADVTSAELRSLHPDIPRLAEIIERYAKRAHLMIELKKLPLDSGRNELTSAQMRGLKETLAPLTPGSDYHIMSIQTGLLEQADREELVPKNALLSIAELNIRAVSEKTLREGWGGFTGQYLLTSTETLRKHQAAGQLVGTGFADSKNILYRELNRGVDWIFTNRAPEMARVVRDTLAENQN